MLKNFLTQLSGRKQQSDPEQENSKTREVGFETISKLIAIFLIPLAVLTVEIATYYYSRNSIEQIENRQEAKPKAIEWLFPIVLIGTGATASGILATILASQIFRSAKIKSEQEEETQQKLTEVIELTELRQSELIQSLTTTVNKIHASTSQETMLETAVQQTRLIMDADRVIVYSLEPESQGQVIIEAVKAGYPKAKGVVIEDPCFTAYYQEKYHNGRIQAIDDIKKANLTTCHLEQLEPFLVKANLVAPILKEDQLMGLLIVHHCKAPHPWQQSEINMIKQITFQISLALKILSYESDFHSTETVLLSSVEVKEDSKLA